MKAYIEKFLVPNNSGLFEFAVRIWKPEKSKASVFCLHGFTGNGSDFSPLARSLSKNGFTVIAPDMPGRGQSAYLSDSHDYKLNLYLRCISELYQFRGKRNFMIGTSWGGTLALVYLASSKAYVDGLILNDPVIKSGQNIMDVQLALKAEAALHFLSLNEAEDYVRKSRSFLGSIPSDFWPEYFAEKVKRRGSTYMMSWDPKLVQNFEIEEPFDLSHMFKAIKIPSLLLSGKGSNFLSADLVESLKLNKNMTIMNSLDASHPPSLMTKDQIYLILGFLGELSV